MKETEIILKRLLSGYPSLEPAESDIRSAFTILAESFEKGGKLLICGNGGSSADALHITGELMKGFALKRELPEDMKKRLAEADPEAGEFLGRMLQGALPAIALNSASSLLTAVANDQDSSLVFAQQVLGYGKPGDVLLGISTSGNADNVVKALITAKASGMRTIGLTGLPGGSMQRFCDVQIKVPGENTAGIQELHLPVYHCLCAMLEEYFFGQDNPASS